MQNEGTITTQTSITLPVKLLTQAKELGINVSQHAQSSLSAEVLRRQQEKWLEDNRAGIEELNSFTEKHGVLTEKIRMF